MPITYCRPLPGREADWGLPNDRTYRRSWLVLTDTRYYFEGQLLADAINFGANPPIPVPYVDTHPNDIFYLCKRLRGKQEKNSPLHWIIDAEYDTKPWGDNDDDDPPLDRRAKITWQTVKYQKVVEKSANGESILNSAGYFFDPPPLRDMSRWTATVTKNLPIVPTDVLNYPDAINDASFTLGGVLVDQYAAKVMSINISDLQNEQGEDYYIFQYTLEFDRDLWNGIYLNQGFYDSDGKRIKDNSTPNEKDVVYPWPLDASGNKITTPTPANATFSTYQIYPAMDFSILPMT